MVLAPELTFQIAGYCLIVSGCLEIGLVVSLIGGATNRWPQSQTNRRAGFWRLHFGHILDHDFRPGGRLISRPAAFRAAREIASARATAHWGCTPVGEYDAFPQTGQRALVGVARMGPGFLSLM